MPKPLQPHATDPSAWKAATLEPKSNDLRDPSEIRIDWQNRPDGVVLLVDETRFDHAGENFVLQSIVRMRAKTALGFLGNFEPLLRELGLAGPLKGRDLFGGNVATSAPRQAVAAFVQSQLLDERLLAVRCAAVRSSLPRADITVKNAAITRMKEPEVHLLMCAVAFAIGDLDAPQLVDVIVDRSSQLGSNDRRLHLNRDELAAMCVPGFEGCHDLRITWSGDDDRTFGDLLVLPDSDAYIARSDADLAKVCDAALRTPQAWIPHARQWVELPGVFPKPNPGSTGPST